MAVIFQNPAAAVYGTIAVGALLAAESARSETYPRTVGAVVVTLLLYWLAYSYADLLGERLKSGFGLTPSALVRTMMYELPILLGASVPLLAVLICWAVGASLTAGVKAAVWTSAAIIVAIESAAAFQARLSRGRLLLQAMAGCLLGLLIVALRALLH